jgi:hypothetical protein
MRILGLNCEVLGNAPIVHALSDVRRQCSLDVVFLSKTHLDEYPAQCLRRRLNMDVKIVNPSDGRSGGVILLWRRDIIVEQIYSAPKYIDVWVIEGPKKVWRLTRCYGAKVGG